MTKLLFMIILRNITIYALPCFCVGPIEFIEADLSTLPPAIGTPDSDKRDFPVLERPKKEGASGGLYFLS
jgi:hypothetical protein